MKVFEFYFNPKARPDVVFGTFCHKPENIYEKRVGNLYMVGVLKNALPQDLSFLDRLSKTIKEKYYAPAVRSPDKSLKDSLKRANQFLGDLVHRGNVSWLGNLSFVTLSIKKSEFNFSKVGNLKTFLIRNGKIVDVDKKVKFQDIEPYPLKIFLNIVSGKLVEDDILLILNEEIAEFFQNQDVFDEIANMDPFQEKQLIKLLNKKTETIQEMSGVCLLIVFKEVNYETRKKTIMSSSKDKDFSFKQALVPVLQLIRKIKLPKINLSKIQLPKREKKKAKQSEKQKRKTLSFKKLAKLKIPPISFPKFTIPFKKENYLAQIEKLRKKIKSFLKHKNTILIFSLILILCSGYLIFKREEEKQLEEYQSQVLQIEEKVNLAESLLIFKTPQSLEDSEALLRQSLEEIDSIIRITPTLSKDFEKQVISLKQKIIENLDQF